MDASPDIAIREARPDDAGAVADILTDAFTGDPVLSWMLGRPRPPREFFLELAKGIYLARGFGHIAEGVAATLWLPSGEKPTLPLINELRLALALVRDCGVGTVIRALKVGEIVAAGHPKSPHYYLFAVGVRASFKGRGYGGRILREGLSRADGARAVAYLENSNPRNTPLYQRLGFDIKGELGLPTGAPPLLAMQREQSAGA
ncbi:MAG: GNAT family N-acetyltransferase [Alphaproteobacteria bacterium]|nr:GNAT family N-acetyltransferase [Alphaproteobacteria bacterium]